MHFLKECSALIALGFLSANTAAAPAPTTAANSFSVIDPLEPRGKLHDRVAILTGYSGGSCDGSSVQHAVTGAGAKRCFVYDGNSIQVSAEYVHPSMLDRLHCLSLDGLAISFLIMFFETGADGSLLVTAIPPLMKASTVWGKVPSTSRTRAATLSLLPLCWSSVRNRHST